MLSQRHDTEDRHWLKLTKECTGGENGHDERIVGTRQGIGIGTFDEMNEDL